MPLLKRERTLTKRKRIQVVSLSDTENEEEESIDDDSFIDLLSDKRVNKPKRNRVEKPFTKTTTKRSAKRVNSITLSELGNHIKKTSSSKSNSPIPKLEKIDDRSIIQDEEYVSWVEKYQPRSVAEVSIHTRKIKEVKTALEEMISGQSELKLLILSGPSGSGKTTIIKQLAKELLPQSQEPLLEWFNPTSLSNVNSFSDFLKSAKYRQGEINKSIILIEDLPFVFHQPTLEAFQKAIYDWIHYDVVEPLPPLVICITEENFESEFNYTGYMDINTNYSIDILLGYKILKETDRKKFKQIKFNPVNVTLMIKILNKIVQDNPQLFKESKEVKDYIGKLTSLGDIRSAILSLQCWANWRTKNSHLFLNFGKESQLDLFHVMGTIVFGSQKVQLSDLLFRVKDSKINKENVKYLKNEKNICIAVNNYLSNNVLKLNSYLVANLRFVSLFILENYSIYKKSEYPIKKAFNILDILSLVNIMTNFHGMNKTGFNLLVRSTRVNLSEDDINNNFTYVSNDKSLENLKFNNFTSTIPQHGKLYFPRDYKSMKRQRIVKNNINFQRYKDFSSIKEKSMMNGKILSFNDINLYHGFYEPLINQQKEYKLKSYSHVPDPNPETQNTLLTLKKWSSGKNLLMKRLGGEFKSLGESSINSDLTSVGATISATKFDFGEEDLGLKDYYKNYEKFTKDWYRKDDNDGLMGDSEDDLELDDPIDDDNNDNNYNINEKSGSWSETEIESDSDLDNF